jgi:hypothetical protein
MDKKIGELFAPLLTYPKIKVPIMSGKDIKRQIAKTAKKAMPK